MALFVCRDTELNNMYQIVRSMGTGVFTKQNVLRRLDHTMDEDGIFYERFYFEEKLTIIHFFLLPRILDPHLETLGSKDQVDAEAYDRFCNKQDRAFSVPGTVLVFIFFADFISIKFQKFIILLNLLDSI